MNTLLLVIKKKNDTPRRITACANEQAAGRELIRLAGEILGARVASSEEAKTAFDAAYAADCDELACIVELLCPEYDSFQTVFVVWQCADKTLSTLEVFFERSAAERLHLKLTNRTFGTRTENPTRARKICEARTRSGSAHAPALVELAIMT